MINNKKLDNFIIYFFVGVIFVLIINFVVTCYISDYTYKKMVSQYLYDKYSRNFKIEIDSRGYKKNLGTGVFSGLNIGHDLNTKEYVYKVYDKDIDDILYITLWKNKKSNDITISEVNGKKFNSTGDGYKDTSYQLYSEKKVISNKLVEVLTEYDDYQIEYDFEGNRFDVDYFINLTFNHSYANELNDNFSNMQSIIETLKNIDKRIFLYVNFTDYNYFYEKNTDIDIEKKKCKFMNDVYTYLSRNITDSYISKGFDTNWNSLNIDIPINIKYEYDNENKVKYEQFYEYIYELYLKNNISVNFNFNGYSVYINRFCPDNIEEYFEKNK